MQNKELFFYQMGEAALIDAGYYKADGTKTNDWTGQWTGKNGIYSKQDFFPRSHRPFDGNAY